MAIKLEIMECYKMSDLTDADLESILADNVEVNYEE
jgi:hypothetical protein